MPFDMIAAILYYAAMLMLRWREAFAFADIAAAITLFFRHTLFRLSAAADITSITHSHLSPPRRSLIHLAVVAGARLVVCCSMRGVCAAAWAVGAAVCARGQCRRRGNSAAVREAGHASRRPDRGPMKKQRAEEGCYAVGERMTCAQQHQAE